MISAGGDAGSRPSSDVREAVFEGRTFFLRDLHLQWLGQAESFVQAVGSGAWPLWDPQRQALHDKVARTNVVRVR